MALLTSGAVRTAVAEPGALTFHLAAHLEPPLLLAMPFAVLTVASACNGECTPFHVAGVLVVAGATTFCVMRGVWRTRIEVRPKSHEIVLQGRAVRLTEAARLTLAQPDVGGLAGSFELTVKDGDRQSILLSSTLPNILNKLEAIRTAWPLPTEIRLDCLPEFTPVGDEPRNWVGGLPRTAELTSETLNRQHAHAGILGAVAFVASIVISVLIRQQVGSGHSISPIAFVLCALLILAPASIAVHVMLSRVRLSIDSDSLRIEHRRGLMGARTIFVPKAELLGLWAVRCHGAQCSELMWLDHGGYRSVPLAERHLEDWLKQLNISPK